MTEIVPAILTNDISDFRKKYSDLLPLYGLVTKLHIDFIDGRFLPEKTILPADLDLKNSPFDLIAHLMVNQPEKYFYDLKLAGFSWVIFHWESFADKNDILGVIAEAKKLGLKTGLAISPETKLYEAAKFIHRTDLLQVMGVNPGAQGRSFEPEALGKIRELKNLLKHAILSIDGGIKPENVRQAVDAGANLVVVGSAITHSAHPKLILEKFKKEIETNSWE